MNNEQQTQQQQADDPSGPGWRWVDANEFLRDDDMQRGDGGIWRATRHPGQHAIDSHTYRRRIEPQPQAEPHTNPDDPSGPGWRDVGPDEILQTGDMFHAAGKWCRVFPIGLRADTGDGGTQYRRRIEPPQPSDSEPETMEDLRRRLAECEVLLAEADRGGQQVNAELQQLREQLATSQHLAEMSRRQVQDEAGKVEQLKEQLQTLTRERDRYRNQLAGAIEHSSAAAGRQQVLESLQAWLRPVLELVAEHPDDASPLAVAVLGYLPGIASRLIEE